MAVNRDFQRLDFIDALQRYASFYGQNVRAGSCALYRVSKGGGRRYLSGKPHVWSKRLDQAFVFQSARDAALFADIFPELRECASGWLRTLSGVGQATAKEVFR